MRDFDVVVEIVQTGLAGFWLEDESRELEWVPLICWTIRIGCVLNWKLICLRISMMLMSMKTTKSDESATKTRAKWNSYFFVNFDKNLF